LFELILQELTKQGYFKVRLEINCDDCGENLKTYKIENVKSPIYILNEVVSCVDCNCDFKIKEEDITFVYEFDLEIKTKK
jgi:hypothetical protein